MTVQKFDVHFWGIPNRRAGHKNDIWSVGNWPLPEFADRVPKDHREEYGPATRMGWQWRYDSSPSNTLITFFTPVQTGEEGEAFFAGSVVVPKGMAIGADLLEQTKDQVCRAAETLSNSRKAERPSSYEPVETTVHPIDSFGASRIAGESWIFEVSSDSDVASICNQLSTLHHSKLTCCFLTKQLSDEHRGGIVRELGKVFSQLQLKVHPDWQALKQEDEARHNEAELKHLEEEKRRKELEELKRIQAEQAALRIALEKEAKRKKLIALGSGLTVLLLLAFAGLSLWNGKKAQGEDEDVRLENECSDKEAIHFTPPDGGPALCVLPSPVYLNKEHVEGGFHDTINFNEHDTAGKERQYVLPGTMDVERTNSQLEQQFNEKGIRAEVIEFGETQALSILFDPSSFDLSELDRMVLDRLNFPDLPVSSISISITGTNRDLDGDGVPAKLDPFPFDVHRCGDSNGDGSDDCDESNSTTAEA